MALVVRAATVTPTPMITGKTIGLVESTRVHGDRNRKRLDGERREAACSKKIGKEVNRWFIEFKFSSLAANVVPNV